MSYMRLMRTTYATDVVDAEPEYPGRFSQPFPPPRHGTTLVGVDWSVRGEVTVTYMLPWTGGDPALWNARDDE